MTITKDNKKYIFKSKFKKLNNLYAITKNDKKRVDQSLKDQINFMKYRSVSFEDDTSSSRSLYDLSYGANIRPDIYYSEMNNRVNSLKEYAEQKHFTQPIFFTITAKSEHKPLKQIKLGKNVVKMVDNPRFNGNPNHVKEAREYLSYSWTKFTKQRVFRDIKEKYGERYVYMKTYEPTMDGVPHLHVVMFVPPSFKNRVVKIANSSFSNSRYQAKTEFDTNVGGVVSYIMKYILKSFQNAKDGKLDDVGYWYAKNSIRRFTTSRTLLPLKIYRLIKSHDMGKDYLEMSKAYNNGDLIISIQKKDPFDYRHQNLMPLSDFHISKIVLQHTNNYWCEHEPLYEKNFNFTIEELQPSPQFKMQKYISRSDLKQKNYIDVQIDEKIFKMRNNTLYETHKQPHEMTYEELYKYFNTLNLQTIDYNHYSYCHNLLVEYDLINEEKYYKKDIEEWQNLF